MKTRRNMTLIELTLALGVVAVGIVAILGLFPVGAEATRDAIGYTHAAESADSFLHLFAANAKDDWAAYITDASPEIPSPASYADRPTDSSTHSPPFGDDGEPGSRGTIHALATDGLYQVLSFNDSDTTNNTLESGALVDFNGVVAVWQEDIPILDTDTGGDVWSPDNRDLGVTLKVEISWPAQAPYAQRNKEVYSLEVFNE